MIVGKTDLCECENISFQYHEIPDRYPYPIESPPLENYQQVNVRLYTGDVFSFVIHMCIIGGLRCRFVMLLAKLLRCECIL